MMMVILAKLGLGHHYDEVGLIQICLTKLKKVKEMVA
jgi:hypothetical protein